MKRGFSVLISIAVIGGIWYLVQFLNRQGPSGWQTLPSGGEVRLLAVTKGPFHQPRLPGPLVTARQIRDAIRTRSWLPLTRNPNQNVSFRTNSPDLCVWLEMQGSKLSPTPNHARIILSDGRRLAQRGGSSTSFGTSSFASSAFSYFPYREKTLHYVCDLADKQFEFSVRNPFYRNDLPVWKGSPLPQSQLVDGVELTLRELIVRRGEPYQRRQNIDWVAEPKWAIKKGDAKADQWFSVGATFEDPSGQSVRDCGLFNEPIWKVRAHMTRTNRYPFREDEIDWLGEVGPEAQAEQTHRLFPIKLTNNGKNKIELGGVFGSGQYSIRNGIVIETLPPTEAAPKAHERVDFDFNTRTIKVRLDKASVVIIGSTFLVFRDANGRPAELDNYWSAGGFSSVALYHLPKEPRRIGTADRGSWNFEFLIPAPNRPVGESTPAK